MLRIITLLCNRFPKFSHYAELKIYTYQALLFFFLLLLIPGNQHFNSCFYEFEYSRCLRYVESYSICSFVTGLLISFSVVSLRFTQVAGAGTLLLCEAEWKPHSKCPRCARRSASLDVIHRKCSPISCRSCRQL